MVYLRWNETYEKSQTSSSKWKQKLKKLSSTYYMSGILVGVTYEGEWGLHCPCPQRDYALLGEKESLRFLRGNLERPVRMHSRRSDSGRAGAVSGKVFLRKCCWLRCEESVGVSPTREAEEWNGSSRKSNHSAKCTDPKEGRGVPGNDSCSVWWAQEQGRDGARKEGRVQRRSFRDVFHLFIILDIILRAMRRHWKVSGGKIILCL